MYFRTTYADEFDDLYMHLKSKYPQKLFDLDGIGRQMDMSEFSKRFFASNVTADASIDANANCEDVSVIAYNTELPKPFFRLNSYYILWKELKKLYGLEVANEIIEMQLTGDIYINDFHGVAAGMPYSYYGKTVVEVFIDGEPCYTTFEDLYEILKNSGKFNEEILNGEATAISLRGITIKDGNGGFTNVERIVKHKSHTNLVGIETKDGHCTLVTTDHPVILEDGSEKLAKDITLSDKIKVSTDNVKITGNISQNDEYAHLVGFMIGSPNGKLPNDVLSWEPNAIKSLIGGLIDSEGNINPNGICTIRTTSFALVQQLSELFRALNIGETRTSFCGKYTPVGGYKSNYDIYRLSCRITDIDMMKYSEKVFANGEIIYKEDQKNGRFEDNRVHKIFHWITPEYVYDITTSCGHFHCQGLVQHNCFNYSTYDVMTKGLPMVKKIKSLPPKYLYAFKSQLEQFTVVASNSTLGAM